MSLALAQHPDVREAVSVLCRRFEQHDYNPTPIIDLGALIANADGTVDQDELGALRDILQPMLGPQLDEELVGYLIEASVQVIQVAGADARARLIAEILCDCDAVEEGLLVALAVAFASDGMSDPERKVIESLAQYASVPAAQLEQLVAKVRKAST